MQSEPVAPADLPGALLDAGRLSGPVDEVLAALAEARDQRLAIFVDVVDPGTIKLGDEVRLGRLAAYVRDKRIPLVMAPTSNVMTGAAASIATHPIGLLRRLGFRVTSTSMMADRPAAASRMSASLGDL